MRTTRTFGAPSGAFGPGIIDQSPTDVVHRPADRPAERAVRDRQHRAVLGELAHRLRERALERADAGLVGRDDGARERSCQHLLDGEVLVLVVRRDDPGPAGREGLADRVVDARLDALAGEPSHEPAGRRADDGRGEQRRRREADEEADPAAVAETLAAEVVAGLLDDDVAGGVLADEDGGLDPDRLRLDGGDEGVEVRVRRLHARVAGDEDVALILSHDLVSLCACASATGRAVRPLEPEDTATRAGAPVTTDPPIPPGIIRTG